MKQRALALAAAVALLLPTAAIAQAHHDEVLVARGDVSLQMEGKQMGDLLANDLGGSALLSPQPLRFELTSGL